MQNVVSKSKLKANLLAYFREVQRTGVALVVTSRGVPVLKIVPYRSGPEEAFELLRGSVESYRNPLEPVGSLL